MSLTLELTPELEMRLRKAAAREGIDTDALALRLIEQSLPATEAPARSLWNTLTAEEWKRVAREWVESHDASLPPLPDEAVSRESFYEGRP